MEKATKLTVFLTLTVLLSLFSSIIMSCNDDENIPNTSEATNEFNATFKESLASILSCPIYTNKTNSRIWTPGLPKVGNGDSIPNFPGYTPIFISTDVDSNRFEVSHINTLLQLEKEAELIGAEISLKLQADSCYVVYMSDDEAYETIDPLIGKAKEYLYSHNFTEDEIQQMLLENDAEESELVPFVMSCIEQEYNATTYSQNGNSFFNVMQFSAYASSHPEIKQIIRCSIKAVGFDVFAEMGESMVNKVISKSLIKKAFKLAVKRVLGPVAVVFVAYEFADCMNWL